MSGVGVFPEREEILIRSTGFGGVALHGVGAGDLEMRECSDWFVGHHLAARRPALQFEG